MARVFQSNVGTAGLPTWGRIRSPIFNGSGYRGTYPANVNWSDIGTGAAFKYSAGYPASLTTQLFRAFPFALNAPGSFMASTASLSIGCNWYYPGSPGPGIPSDIAYVLNVGVARYDFANNPNSETNELGYFFGTEPYMQGSYGYDTYSLRERCRGGVVNVTINLVGGGSYTGNITITDDLFPDSLQANPYGGIPITQEPGGTGVPTGFWWTINSLTLP